MKQALEQRSRIAISRLKALRLARNLLDTTHTPHALQQVSVLWGSVPAVGLLVHSRVF